MKLSDIKKKKKTYEDPKMESEEVKEEESVESSEESKYGENLGRDILECLLEMRDTAHLFHLQTDSHAHHSILNEFYDSILDLADNFAETWQGAYGIITGGLTIKVTDYSEVNNDARAWMQSMKEKTMKYYKEIEAPCLLAIMDNMLILMDTTIDLLRRK
jgi:hypothetical protein